MADARVDRIYYEDQASWGPDDFYALWRYLNRMFLDRRGGRAAEMAAIDLGPTSDDTRYLMKHLLILQGRYEATLARFPNLRGLDDVGELGHPLHLSSEPTLAHDYFTRMGIYL